jgi:hypothetical protein
MNLTPFIPLAAIAAILVLMLLGGAIGMAVRRTYGLETWRQNVGLQILRGVFLIAVMVALAVGVYGLFENAN